MQFVTLIIVSIFVCISSVIAENKNSSREFPVSFDWRNKNVIAPIYDQGTSPDVAAIVMVETIESLYAIKTGNLIRGSVARVIDCCQKYTIDYDCIAQMGGICRDSDYPSTLGTCEPNACVPFATFNKLVVFRGLDDEQLVPLIQNATLLISVDASTQSFAEYINGVFQDQTCSSIYVDHVLQLVGYGRSEKDEPFWIAKNSWGKAWGDHGYIRILRGKNICGIATEVYQPLMVSETTTPLITSTKLSEASQLFCLWHLVIVLAIFSKINLL